MDVLFSVAAGREGGLSRGGEAHRAFAYTGPSAQTAFPVQPGLPPHTSSYLLGLSQAAGERAFPGASTGSSLLLSIP